jgi:uncharacterized membrane protein YpjA
MLITHALMIIEALPLAYTIERLRFYHIIALGWLLVNDYFDYVVGTHPYMPGKEIEVIAAVTIFLSFLSFTVTAITARSYS